MCISAEDTSLGCNGLSLQHQGEGNTIFPGITGEYYTRENTEKINANEPNINSAIASCDNGE